MSSSTPHGLKLVGVGLEQCSNGHSLTFFKLCRDCQSLHAVSRWLACSSCEWGGNHLLTPRKSLNLLTWLQHCQGGFHITFLPLSSCPVEWGVGSGLQGLLNSSSSYTLIEHQNLLSLLQKSVVRHQSLLYPLAQSIPCSPPQYWVSKSVTVFSVTLWTPKSVTLGVKVYSLFHLLSVFVNPSLIGPHWAPKSVTCCYYSPIPVTNEPHLASRESKSCLISGGNSS